MSLTPSPPPYRDSDNYEFRRDISAGVLVNGRLASEANVYLAALVQAFDASAEWWAVLQREVERGMADGGRDWILVVELKRGYLMYGRRPLRQAWNMRGGRRGEGEMVKRAIECLRGVLEDLGEEGRDRVDFLQGIRTGRAGWNTGEMLRRPTVEEDELPGYEEVVRRSGSRSIVTIVSGGGEMYASGQLDGQGQGWVRRVWHSWMHIDDDVPVHLRGTVYGRFMRDM
ncbi:hypothetical protein ACMFMG_011479 [Clarireedia jacksonii]